MKIRSWIKVPSVLIIGAGLALAMPAMAAVGASSPPSTAIQIEANKVALLGNGVAVEMPVRYVCPAGALPEGAGAQISAVSHKALVTASTNFNVKCTGTFQHIDLVLAVQGQSFKPGPALAEASMTVCSFIFPCSTTTTAKALTLK